MPKRIRYSLILAGLFLAVGLWIWCFRGYFWGKQALIDDAVAYYEHSRFYLDNIHRGVFPLWNPTDNYGSPNEFFLCRIGPYNPLVNLPLVFSTMVSPYYKAHVLSLWVNYFIGLAGFFLVARRYHRDNLAAYLSTIILLFSSLGVRLFDSYILIMFFPLPWFFYFLWTFFEAPRIDRFWGLVLTLFVISSTYIPSYFAVLFFTFLISGLIFFGRSWRTSAKEAYRFLLKRPLAVLLAAVLLVGALMPGVLFFLRNSQVVAMPMRHYEAQVAHAAGVPEDIVTKWAILEDIVFSQYFLENFQRMNCAVFYIPGFLYLIFLIGTLTPITWRQGCLLVWGGTLLLLGIPHASGLYNFLYDNVSAFKYFRNLHFFLWIILLPIFVIYVVEQLRMILTWTLNGRARTGFLFFVTAVHMAVGWYLVRMGTTLPVTFVTLVASWLFFCLIVFRPQLRQSAVLPFILLVIVAAEPVAVYGYLSQNVETVKGRYRYERPYLDFQYVTQYHIEIPPQVTSFSIGKKEEPPLLYYGTKWYDILRLRIKDFVRDVYALKRFIIYDRVETFDEKTGDYEKLGRFLWELGNTAFVPSGTPIHAEFQDDQTVPPDKATVITGASPIFEVTKYNSNGITFLTAFDRPKFVVYNDNYAPEWRCLVDGKLQPLYRANISFKGMWIPAGHHTVTLKYASEWKYWLNRWLVFGGFLLMFLTIGSNLRIRSGRSLSS